VADDPNEVYSKPQRVLHWLTALLIFITVPVAFAMSGMLGKVSDAAAAFLYDSHKLIGITIFIIVIARLILRMTKGAPSPEPMHPLQRLAADITHWMMYALLILVPIGGYVALQYFGEIRLFGMLPLPSFDEPNKELSERLFSIHKLAAFTLVALVILHFTAAMFHRFIVKDNVLGRMWPSQLRRNRDLQI
jgi:cytochrome b561